MAQFGLHPLTRLMEAASRASAGSWTSTGTRGTCWPCCPITTAAPRPSRTRWASCCGGSRPGRGASVAGRPGAVEAAAAADRPGPELTRPRVRQVGVGGGNVGREQRQRDRDEIVFDAKTLLPAHLALPPVVRCRGRCGRTAQHRRPDCIRWGGPKRAKHPTHSCPRSHTSTRRRLPPEVRGQYGPPLELSFIGQDFGEADTNLTWPGRRALRSPRRPLPKPLGRPRGPRQA